MISQAHSDHRNKVKERYGFAAWGGKTRGPEAGLTRNFLIPWKYLSPFKVERQEVTPVSLREGREVTYIFISPEAPKDERLLIRVWECDGVATAHEALIDVVMTFMATSLPPCSSLDLEIGDVCFGSHGNRQVAMIFARNNLLIDIRSLGLRKLAVSSYAAKLDQLIGGDLRNFLVMEPKDSKPVSFEFQLSSDTAGVDGEIVVKVAAADPGVKDFMVLLLGTGGTFMPRGEDFVFLAKTLGSHLLRIIAVNEEGQVAQQERTIQVA